MPRALAAILLASLLAFAALAPTAAASGSAVIRDCTDDGRLDGNYSQEDLQDARANLPTDVDEYTDCRDVIRRAQLRGRRSGGGGGSGGDGSSGGGGASGGGPSGGGSSPDAAPTPLEENALAEARRGGGDAISVGGRTVTPGADRFTDDVRHSLPGPLIAVLALLGAAALAGGGVTARNLVVRRRQA